MYAKERTRRVCNGVLARSSYLVGVADGAHRVPKAVAETLLEHGLLVVRVSALIRQEDSVFQLLGDCLCQRGLACEEEALMISTVRAAYRGDIIRAPEPFEPWIITSCAGKDMPTCVRQLVDCVDDQCGSSESSRAAGHVTTTVPLRTCTTAELTHDAQERGEAALS